jgi:CelD/BcsL family acetyltransferase involved in cellulose biosynthesis
MQDDRFFDSDSLAFQVLTELPDIAALASEWDSLLERSVCNRAFSSSKWFIATCRHNSSLQPYIVTARRGAALAGILPLVLTGEAQVATFTNYLTDYSDAIAAQDDPAAVAGLLNYARSASQVYNRIVLSHIRRDSNCLRALGLIEPGSWIDQSFREMVLCYYLRLPASHDDFLRTKDSRFRKRLKRLQGLADKSNLRVCELEPDNFPPHKLPEAFLSLHLERQKVKSCFEAAAAQSFVEEVIPDLFKARIIRACTLVERDKIVAIDLYAMGSNSLCVWNGGFLSEAEHCSPGKLLINAGIKLACALKLEEYDFMRGPEDYKTSWANDSRPIGQLELNVAAEH